MQNIHPPPKNLDVGERTYIHTTKKLTHKLSSPSSLCALNRYLQQQAFRRTVPVASTAEGCINQCIQPTKRTCNPCCLTHLSEAGFLFFLMSLISALLLGYIARCTASGPCPRTAMYSRMFKNARDLRNAFAAVKESGNEGVARPSSIIRDCNRAKRQTASVLASGFDRKL
jgi:hypothetical protein